MLTATGKSMKPEKLRDILLRPRNAGFPAALRTERKAIRTSLKELAADKAPGLIDRDQLITGTERGKARLDEIDTLLRAAEVDSPLRPLLDTEDIEEAWKALRLSHQRLVARH